MRSKIEKERDFFIKIAFKAGDKSAYNEFCDVKMIGPCNFDKSETNREILFFHLHRERLFALQIFLVD